MSFESLLAKEVAVLCRDRRSVVDKCFFVSALLSNVFAGREGGLESRDVAALPSRRQERRRKENSPISCTVFDADRNVFFLIYIVGFCLTYSACLIGLIEFYSNIFEKCDKVLQNK